MAARGVTYEQVAAVAERLVGEQAEPTLRAVRAKLGTGSMATLRNHLARWREARAAPRPTHHDVGASVLAALNQEISARAAEVTAELEKRLGQASEELEAISAESEQRAARLEEIATELSAAVHERDRLTGRLQELEAELARARAERDDARRSAAQAAVALERVPTLETALEQLRTEMRASEKRGADALREAEVRAARAEGELAARKR